jgi:hypothetical protein
VCSLLDNLSDREGQLTLLDRLQVSDTLNHCELMYFDEELYLSTAFGTVIGLLLVLDVSLQAHHYDLHSQSLEFQYLIPEVKNHLSKLSLALELVLQSLKIIVLWYTLIFLF